LGVGFTFSARSKITMPPAMTTALKNFLPMIGCP
jgi:hypothetical protein